MVILTCFVLIISLWLKPRNRFTGFKNPYRLIHESEARGLRLAFWSKLTAITIKVEF